MRVALITTSFPMTTESSDGIFVARLADALAVSVDLTVITPEGVHGAPEPRGNYAVRGFRYAARPWQRLAHAPGGIPVALRRQPWLWLLVPSFLVSLFVVSLRAARHHDLLHANWAVVGAVAGLAGRICRTPVVTTLRGADVTRMERSSVDRFLLRLALRTNKQLIGVSSAIRDQIRSLVPGSDDRVTVIANGVDDCLFDLPERSERSDSGAVKLLTVGSLIPRKSVITIVDALARIDDLDACLDIVGDGPEKEPLAARIEQLGLADRVRLSGPVPPHRIEEQLRTTDVFVMASRSEGRPNALLEAMAAGLAVAVPAIAGIVELVEDGRTGLLHEQGDVPGLSRCLRRLVQDGALRRRLGAAARMELDIRGLRWRHTAQGYLATYRAAVEGS